MRIEEWNLLHDMVVTSATELLDSIGLRTTYGGSVPHRDARWAESLAVIGLGGKLRGTLILSIPAELIKKSHPTGGTDSADLADWLAELANLLLGRVKSRLLTHGIGIELSTPLTLSAIAFRFERFTGTPVVHQFDVTGEKLQIVFEAIAEKDLWLAPARADAVVNAGEIVTF